MSLFSKMTVGEVNEYVKSHGVLLPNKQVFIDKPMYVFKKVYTYQQTSPITLLGIDNLRQEMVDYRCTKHHAVANLVIPKGAIVNLIFGGKQKYSSTSDLDKKLRASMAYCWSICRTKNGVENVTVASSKYSRDFTYIPCQGNLMKDKFDELVNSYPDDRERYFRDKYGVIPSQQFDMTDTVYASGIHFFVEAESAVNYEIY